MREYAFDVKMFAVVRISAATRDKAEAAMTRALDCADLNVTVSEVEGKVKITEASVHVDDVDYPYLFELTGTKLTTTRPRLLLPEHPEGRTTDRSVIMRAVRSRDTKPELLRQARHRLGRREEGDLHLRLVLARS